MKLPVYHYMRAQGKDILPLPTSTTTAEVNAANKEIPLPAQLTQLPSIQNSVQPHTHPLMPSFDGDIFIVQGWEII